MGAVGVMPNVFIGHQDQKERLFWIVPIMTNEQGQMRALQAAAVRVSCTCGLAATAINGLAPLGGRMRS